MVKRQVSTKNNRLKQKNPTESSEFSVVKPKREKTKLEKLKAKREALVTDLQHDYLDNIPKIHSKDLAVITQPTFFPDNKKKDRHYNRAVERVLADLKLFAFLLIQMKPLYRLKILKSTQWSNVLDQVLGVGVGAFQGQTKEEKIIALNITMQMLETSLAVINKEMPKEFRKSLVKASEPLNDLLLGISQFSKNYIVKMLRTDILQILKRR